MNYEDLKAGIETAPLKSRVALEQLLLYATMGGTVKPEFEEYLEGAQTYRDFFNNIYADPARKNSTVWAEWAKLMRKSWLSCFEPKLKIENLRLKSDGLPLAFGTGLVLAPTGSRDNIANLYLFASGAFNTEAAEFVTSLGGKFTCADLDFSGVYGLYRYRGNVILEEWQVDGDPVLHEVD